MNLNAIKISLGILLGSILNTGLSLSLLTVFGPLAIPVSSACVLAIIFLVLLQNGGFKINE